MTIQEIYDLAIRMGIESDLRGREKVEKNLRRINEKYQKLDNKKKEDFDVEKLVNPYSDTRIHFGDRNKEIKKVLVGVDMDTAEILLAEKLGNIDLVIAHHPVGSAYANLDDVMSLQVEVLASYGVPINIAEKLLEKRISEVSRGISPRNHYQSVDAARLLNIPFMNVHTPCDNLVAAFLKREIEDKKPEYVEDIMEILKSIPEYKEAKKRGAGPRLFSGKESNFAGKVAITEITGGTEGAPEIYEKMAQAGIGTIISMHASENHRKEAEKANINMVIAGHISSDSVGMNLFFDELEKRGMEVVPCSGFIRVKRIAFFS